MNNIKIKNEKEIKRLEKQRLLLQMKKDIESIKRQIKYLKLINLKISSVKNLKITARVLQIFAPYIVSAGITAGGFAICGKIPFYPSEDKIYSHVMKEFDNLGNIQYKQQYNTFENETNMAYFYSEWQLQDEGFYSRTIKSYKIKDKSYEELLELFNRENLIPEDIFEKPISTIKETKNNLSDDEINEKPFFKVVMYSKDLNDYIVRKETIDHNILFSTLYIFITVLVELAVYSLREEFSSFDFELCLERINRKYKPIDIEELTHKLEIRRDNYNRMVG